MLGNRRLINTCNCDLSLKLFSCSRLRKAFMAERRPFDLILKKFRLSCFKMRCATELPLSPAPVTGRGVKSWRSPRWFYSGPPRKSSPTTNSITKRNEWVCSNVAKNLLIVRANTFHSAGEASFEALEMRVGGHTVGSLSSRSDGFYSGAHQKDTHFNIHDNAILRDITKPKRRLKLIETKIWKVSWIQHQHILGMWRWGRMQKRI